MEHFFQGEYLRVLKPVTVDGLNVAMDDEFRGQFKEVHLPITALPDLELKNSKLPPAQKMRITRVNGQEPISKPAPKKATPPPVIEDEIEETGEVEAPKPAAKRGPKPKSNDLD